MTALGADLLISADSHVIEEPHFWEKRLPVSFKDQAPVFPERHVGGLFQAHPGGWDPNERVKEMAVDGVSGEVLYPSFALDLFGMQDAALQEACFRVYNDWIMGYCSVAPDRLFGVACISTYDIDHAVAELERCKKARLAFHLDAAVANRRTRKACRIDGILLVSPGAAVGLKGEVINLRSRGQWHEDRRSGVGLLENLEYGNVGEAVFRLGPSGAGRVPPLPEDLGLPVVRLVARQTAQRPVEPSGAARGLALLLPQPSASATT